MTELFLHFHSIYPANCFFVNRSNLLPEEAIIVEADEKAELVESLPSLCLKQVFPKYMKQFNFLRILERITDIFLRFLGVKGTMKLGPTSFRTFIRQDWPILLYGWNKAWWSMLILDNNQLWGGVIQPAAKCILYLLDYFPITTWSLEVLCY